VVIIFLGYVMPQGFGKPGGEVRLPGIIIIIIIINVLIVQKRKSKICVFIKGILMTNVKTMIMIKFIC
jgi:hypothetical protein